LSKRLLVRPPPAFAIQVRRASSARPPLQLAHICTKNRSTLDRRLARIAQRIARRLPYGLPDSLLALLGESRDACPAAYLTACHIFVWNIWIDVWIVYSIQQH
jgi:hypothetical protein